MDLLTELDGETLVACPAGSINSGNAAELEAELVCRLPPAGGSLVLDLSDLSYISSAGLRVVLVLAKRLREQEGRLILCGLRGAVLEVFDISGFLGILTVREHRSEALLEVISGAEDSPDERR